MSNQEPLYRIEERSPTTGEWYLIDVESQGLTKEQCKQKLDFHMKNEVNPNHMRVSREQ